METNIDDIVTIAFRSYYEMIILRNEKGKDERKKKLQYIFVVDAYTLWCIFTVVHIHCVYLWQISVTPCHKA